MLKEHEILAEALNQSLGSLDLEKLKSLVRAGEAGLVHLDSPPENLLLSKCYTRYGLELERWAVAFVDATKETLPTLNPDFIPSERLSSEQADAVKAILGTRDQVFSFRGVAGAGKTTSLREVQRALNEAEHTVFAITPTTSAAKVLQDEGFVQATIPSNDEPAITASIACRWRNSWIFWLGDKKSQHPTRLSLANISLIPFFGSRAEKYDSK